jgi:Zn-finger nucleic acid-binding protein
MSEVARAYPCPSCGAAVEEQARRCIYCRAPVATVRCAACFHMNVVEAIHCSGCGRETGLEPVGSAAELSCPHCHAALDAFAQASGSLFDCGTCGGQFVEHAALRELVDRRDLPVAVGTPPSRRFVAQAGPVKYVPCPVCKSLMNRKNFGGTSGVVVDVCKPHGTWFDLGELPRVLAFVAQGGLARERQRQVEEAADLRRRAIAARRPEAEPRGHVIAEASAAHVPPIHGFEEGRFGGFLIDLLLR